MSFEDERGNYKRIRAGHKASAARIIAQVKDGLDSTECNVPKLEQQHQKLKTKYDDLRKLDSDILGTLEAEDDILNKIEQTDLFNDEIELTILLLDEALSKEPMRRLILLIIPVRKVLILWLKPDIPPLRERQQHEITLLRHEPERVSLLCRQ